MTHRKELLTSTQAGVLLRKSGRTVQRMADARALPFVHKMPGPNGAYLFRRADVEAWLEAHQQPARP